jgi:hypothetical protein
VRDYLCAFDLMSIVVTADRRINGTRDVAGATGAWWCEAREVRRIIWLARKDGGEFLRQPKRSGSRSPSTRRSWRAPKRQVTDTIEK